MRRRLPLAPSAPPLVAPDLPAERVAAPAAIGVADAAEGGDSFAFACELAGELAREGRRVRLALLAYEALPGLPSLQASGPEEPTFAISRHAVSRAGELLPELAWHDEPVTLLVGSPALASFAPGLAVLIAGERASNMAPHLRALRGRVHLELSAARPGLATSLAQRLLACGFLPRA